MEIRLNGPGEEAPSSSLLRPCAVAGTTMLAGRILKDVDGDGVLDAVIPTPGGIAIHPGENGGFTKLASFRGRLPGDERFSPFGSALRDVPIPRVEDADGDGRPDLVVGQGGTGPWIAIARGLGGGRFAAARTIDLDCLTTPEKDRGPGVEERRRPSPSGATWRGRGDVDGAGRIEIVTRGSRARERAT